MHDQQDSWMFYGQMSQKYNFLDDMGPIIPG